jgi:hypothetical protein
MPKASNSKNAKPFQIKKPANAFFLYRSDMKEKILHEYGSKTSQEISRKAGELWKQESESIKTKYQLAAQKVYEKFKLEHRKTKVVDFS